MIKFNLINSIYSYKKQDFSKTAKQDVGFSGVNSVMGSKSFSQITTPERLREFYPNSLGIVGNLAFDWIKHIPKQEREGKIKGLYKAFDEVATIFREGEKTSYVCNGQNFLAIDPHEKTLKNAANSLSQAFKNININQDKPLNFELLGIGAMGSSFKFDINGIKHVFKVFHQVKSELYQTRHAHGSFFENNRFEFIKNKCQKDNQFPEFTFGNIKSGYIVTKFIDENEMPKRAISLTSLGFKLNQFEIIKNMTQGGKIYDVGGLEVQNAALANSKENRYKFKKEMLESLRLKAENKEKRVITDLTRVIYSLPQDLKLKGFKIIADNAEPHEKKELSNIISTLPAEKRIIAIKMIAKNADKPAKLALIRQIYCLPKENKYSAFKILAKDSDEEIRAELEKRLCDIPKEKQQRAYNLLYQRTEEKTK